MGCFITRIKFTCYSRNQHHSHSRCDEIGFESPARYLLLFNMCVLSWTLLQSHMGSMVRFSLLHIVFHIYSLRIVLLLAAKIGGRSRHTQQTTHRNTCILWATQYTIVSHSVHMIWAQQCVRSRHEYRMKEMGKKKIRKKNKLNVQNTHNRSAHRHTRGIERSMPRSACMALDTSTMVQFALDFDVDTLCAQLK